MAGYPDEVLSEGEMLKVMGWLFLHARNRCPEGLAAHAEDENAEQHAKCIEDILIRAFLPEMHEERQIAIEGAEFAALRKRLKVPEPWSDDWREEARNLVKLYWDELDRTMHSERFILDRLRSEKGREKVLNCFEVRFESILHKSIAWCLNGTDRPLLFFKFEDGSNSAYWVRRKDVPVLLHSHLDDLFENAGKPRPFATPSSRPSGRRKTTTEQWPDEVLAEGEMRAMTRWVYLVGRDHGRANIVEKAERAVEQADRGEEPDDENIDALKRLLGIRRGIFNPPSASNIFFTAGRIPRPWHLGLREWVGLNSWRTASKKYVESRYLSPDADGVYGRRFIRDRLESKNGQSKLMNCYRTDFRVLEGRYEPVEGLRTLGLEKPVMLWFVFRELDDVAFGLHEDGFSIEAQVAIDDCFQKKGKGRPFGTLSEGLAGHPVVVATKGTDRVEAVPQVRDDIRSRLHALPELRWNEVIIDFETEETVKVTARDVSEKCSYVELGFKDKRKGAPNTRWAILRELANHGEISWQVDMDTKKRGMVKAAVSEIRKRLKDFFGIEKNPIPPYRHSRLYKPKFILTIQPHLLQC